MPVLDLHIAPNIYAWEILEDEAYLTNMVNLSIEEEEMIFNFTRKQRRKEMLATRALLSTLIPNEHIHYKNKNPFLVNSKKEISISNSKKTVAIQLNEAGEKTGVDIQYFSDTVLRVKDKFLHQNEYELIKSENALEILNIIWSAKESLYKAFSEDKLNFKKQIEVKEIGGKVVTGVIHQNNKILPFELGVFLNEEFVLTWFMS